MIILRSIPVYLCFLTLASCSSQTRPGGTWNVIETNGVPTARHEASFVSFEDKLYLIGGRRINPVDVFDPSTYTWSEKSKTPIELHHFQSVVINEAIYIVGAMTGPWPNETPLEHVMIYNPKEDRFEKGHAIPKDRQRGGAGVVVYNGKIYIVGGITNGHVDGSQNWFDEYDPMTGEWRVLADAPHKRDHFAAAIISDKLYAFAGRQTAHGAGVDFGNTQETGDVYDFKSGVWEAASKAHHLPTRRAGNMVHAWEDKLFIGGGESDTQMDAHSEVDVFDVRQQKWSKGPALHIGRHGSGFAIIDDHIYTASGCAKRGGEPELTSIERMKLN